MYLEQNQRIKEQYDKEEKGNRNIFEPSEGEPWSNSKSCCHVTTRLRVQAVETTSARNAR